MRNVSGRRGRVCFQVGATACAKALRHNTQKLALLGQHEKFRKCMALPCFNDVSLPKFLSSAGRSRRETDPAHLASPLLHNHHHTRFVSLDQHKHDHFRAIALSAASFWNILSHLFTWLTPYHSLGLISSVRLSRAISPESSCLLVPIAVHIAKDCIVNYDYFSCYYVYCLPATLECSMRRECRDTILFLLYPWCPGQSLTLYFVRNLLNKEMKT